MIVKSTQFSLWLQCILFDNKLSIYLKKWTIHLWEAHFKNKTCKKYKCLMKPGIKMTRFEAQDNKVLAQWHRWPDKYNSWVDKKVIQNAWWISTLTWRVNPAWMSSWIIYMAVLRIECHIPLDTFFSIRETSYSLRGNCINLCLTKFSLMRNSFTYKCTQLWNKVLEDVKLANDVDVFKSKLRSIQL